MKLEGRKRLHKIDLCTSLRSIFLITYWWMGHVLILGDTIARQMGLRCKRKATEQEWEQASKQCSSVASELVPASRIQSCVSTLAFLSDEVWNGNVGQITPLSPSSCFGQYFCHKNWKKIGMIFPPIQFVLSPIRQLLVTAKKCILFFSLWGYLVMLVIIVIHRHCISIGLLKTSFPWKLV